MPVKRLPEVGCAMTCEHARDPGGDPCEGCEECRRAQKPEGRRSREAFSKLLGCTPISTYVARFPALPSVQHHPIEYTILGLAQGLENLSEQLPEEVVVWRLLKPKLADIVHVDGKLLWRPWRP